MATINQPRTPADSAPSRGEELTGLFTAIQAARRDAGDPSLREIARRTRGGLSASTFSRMLASDRPPKLDNLLCFLRALGIPESKLPAWRARWHRAANEADPISPSAGPGDGPPPGHPLESIMAVCPACGAFVADRTLHHNWHRGRGAGVIDGSPKRMAYLSPSPRPAIVPLPR
jgi:hypothetical protein